MLELLDSENADRDIKTALITCLTDTPSTTHARMCQAVVFLGDGTKNLDGTGGNFSLQINLGSQVGPVKTIALAATTVRGVLTSDLFCVPANTAVTVWVLSPNAADADVDVTAYLYDVNNYAALFGLIAGKKIVNATGTQVTIYDYDGSLKVTLDRTGTGPFTWTPTWA